MVEILAHVLSQESNHTISAFLQHQVFAAVASIRLGIGQMVWPIHDIHHELKDQGHEISINSLSVLLREEGFARLPWRWDEERPSSIKPEPAQVTDVHNLDLSPRMFRTRVVLYFRSTST